VFAWPETLERRAVRLRRVSVPPKTGSLIEGKYAHGFSSCTRYKERSSTGSCGSGKDTG